MLIAGSPQRDSQWEIYFNPRTLRALRALELIEPMGFTPCFPVPVPDSWQLTEAGRKAFNSL